MKAQCNDVSLKRMSITCLVFTLTSCAIPPYDEKMDEQLTNLQLSMDTSLGEIEGASFFYEQSIRNNATSKENIEKLKKQCSYEVNYNRYSDINAKINYLVMRLSVTPNIPQGPINAMVAMQKNFKSLQEMHATHQPCLKSVNFAEKRMQLNGDFYPIYSYLLQTKVGTTESKTDKSNK
ncbi:hypothetical protein ABFV38_16235 [Enterobacter cloacae complex sp. Mu1197]|uniref:Lipoprotein n=1 Tax=Enterobacter cloacae complex sp. Mu1197 TaxID=3152302 RepID=A0AAU7FR36_9ENTR